MQQFTQQDIAHIAGLARLHVTPAEQEKFSREFASIFTFIEMLNEVQTDTVEPLAQAIDIQNAFREDTLGTVNVSTEALKNTSALPIIDNQIQTLSAH